jgi:glycerol uptake facilitator-like aquaporin
VTRSLSIRLGAEFAGTAALVGIGTGAIVLGATAGGIPQWSLAVAWFAAVTVPVVLFAEVSGAHLNPAITIALGVRKRSSRGEMAPYIAAQVAGAFLGSAAVWALFGDRADLGATVPSAGGLAAAFAEEFLFTFLLVTAVFVLVDLGWGRGRWRLLLPGAVVGVATYLIGPWTGSSLNPARSIAPAVLSGAVADLWLYLLAVPLGALAAAAVAPGLFARASGTRRAGGPARLPAIEPSRGPSGSSDDADATNTIM